MQLSTRRRLSALLVAAVLAAAGCADGSSRADDETEMASSGPRVTTSTGPVRGVYGREGVEQYLGIPYAQAPVGDLRWRPPQAVESWTETRSADTFADSCPQVTGLGVFAGPVSTTEDCLYLNVFTTGVADEPKPVIVWIHGGGNINGSSSDYDGTKLAIGGPDGTASVVVTLNYRLGLFGTFSHAGVDDGNDVSGNFGILDQQAALRWVRDNIEQFGGDPARVTVAGQSAGAYNTAAHLLSPLSEGLFHRAILMSSPTFVASSSTAQDAAQRGRDFAEAAHCPGANTESAQCLRSLSAERILQLQGTPNETSDYTIGRPFVDGEVIPVAAEEAWETGQFNRVPIIGGATKDEMTFFTGIDLYFSGPPQQPLRAEGFAAAIEPGEECNFCPGRVMPAGVTERYAIAEYDGDPMETYQRIGSDAIKCSEQRVLRRLVAHVPTFAYDFTYEDSPYYFPVMPGYRPLASHTSDLQFFFDNFHGGRLGVNVDHATGQLRELAGDELGLSDRMVGQWTRFAETGSPNGPGLVDWPEFTAAGPGAYMVQDIPTSTIAVDQFRQKYQCDFWDPLAAVAR